MSRYARHTFNIALCAGAASCLIPAIQNNLTGLINAGGYWYQAATYIVPVVAASASAITLERAMKDRRYYLGIVATALLITTITFNLTNALSASRTTRAAFAEPRANVAETIKRLENERTDILGSLGTASANGDLPSVEELEIKRQESEANFLFKRSKQCTEDWLSDSKDHCGQWRDLLGKLAAAKDRASKIKRLDDIRGELSTLHQPQIVDAKIDGLLDILAGLGWAKEGDRAQVGLGYDILLAAFVELLAAFGPGIFLAARFAAPKPQPAPVAPIQASVAATPVDINMPADVRAFLEQHVNVRAGTKVSAEDLCAAFNFAHPDRMKPIKPALLGRYVNALYAPAKDLTRKNAVYLGIELLPHNATKLDAMKRK